MQLDLYRRPEPHHKLSFLAVPSGKPLPQEVANVDWLLEAKAVELDVDAPRIERYAIDGAAAQIRDKGYAITSIEHQVEARD